MDNEASNMICEWMEKENAAYQKVPHDNHRTNIAECCIETGKHHFISILAGTDDAFPINQWDQLITQAEWTLNMLRPCHINPKISIYAYLEDHHDYNRVPFRRASWACHGVKGFAIAPAPEHYRCITCWIPSTGGERKSDTVMFFPPKDAMIPSLPTPEETVNEAARELGKALQQMATTNPLYSHLGTFAGLKQLTGIVRQATPNAQAQRVAKETVPVQRLSEQARDAPQANAQPQAIPFEDDEIDQHQRVGDDDPIPAPRKPSTRTLRDPLFNRPTLPSTHRYPIRHKALNILLQQKGIQLPPKPATPQPATSIPNLLPYFINAILDDATGEINLEAILYDAAPCGDIQLNVVIDPKTGAVSPPYL
ncbi:hypothetical protein ACHAWF_003197 [Thalassiosira exigua]